MRALTGASQAGKAPRQRGAIRRWYARSTAWEWGRRDATLDAGCTFHAPRSGSRRRGAAAMCPCIGILHGIRPRYDAPSSEAPAALPAPPALSCLASLLRVAVVHLSVRGDVSLVHNPHRHRFER